MQRLSCTHSSLCHCLCPPAAARRNRAACLCHRAPRLRWLSIPNPTLALDAGTMANGAGASPAPWPARTSTRVSSGLRCGASGPPASTCCSVAVSLWLCRGTTLSSWSPACRTQSASTVTLRPLACEHHTMPAGRPDGRTSCEHHGGVLARAALRDAHIVHGRDRQQPLERLRVVRGAIVCTLGGVLVR